MSYVVKVTAYVTVSHSGFWMRIMSCTRMVAAYVTESGSKRNGDRIVIRYVGNELTSA